MGLFLQVEVESSLAPIEFRKRVIVPLGDALEREHLGRVLDDGQDQEAGAEGHYEVALEVSDQARARAVVEAVLESVDA